MAVLYIIILVLEYIKMDEIDNNIFYTECKALHRQIKFASCLPVLAGPMKVFSADSNTMCPSHPLFGLRRKLDFPRIFDTLSRVVISERQETAFFAIDTA